MGHPVDITLSYYYLKTEDVTDYGQLEPVPSGFYEEADNVRPLRPRHVA